MLGKLMKHEFRATGRVVLPLCAAMLALGVLAGCVLRFWGDGADYVWWQIVGGSILTLYGISVCAVAVGVFVILMQRFKSHLFGDEGYLTRTLPVSEHELLLSKLFTALAWYLAAGVLTALSVLLAGALSGELRGEQLGDFFRAVRSYAPRVCPGDAACVGLMLLGGMAFLTLLLYAVNTLAQSFRKHRFLYFVMLFVILIALLRLLSVVNSAVDSALEGILLSRGAEFGVIGGADGPTAIYVTRGAAPWVTILELYLGNALLYFLTWGFLKKRTNLA